MSIFFTSPLLVVWSVNGNGSALTSKVSSMVNLLNDDILTDEFVRP